MFGMYTCPLFTFCEGGAGEVWIRIGGLTIFGWAIDGIFTWTFVGKFPWTLNWELNWSFSWELTWEISWAFNWELNWVLNRSFAGTFTCTFTGTFTPWIEGVWALTKDEDKFGTTRLFGIDCKFGTTELELTVLAENWEFCGI